MVLRFLEDMCPSPELKPMQLIEISDFNMKKQRLHSTFAFAQKKMFLWEMHHLLYLYGFAEISCAFPEQQRMTACVAPGRKIS